MKLRTLLLTALFAMPALAGTRRLTIDDIYDPQKKLPFGGVPQTGFVWVDDEHFFWPKTNAASEVVAEALVDAKSGKEEVPFDVNDLQAQVAKVNGVTEEDAKKLARPKSPTFNPKKDSLLLTVQHDLYIYHIPSKTLTRLTSGDGEEEEASFSPDGKSVAFVRNDNLWVVDVATKVERFVTRGGSESLHNGKLDWVYQEEVYGRGIFKGWWWSPDSKSLAYLQLDEKHVPRFTVVDHIPYPQKLENENYPKAGDPNPIAKLFVVSASGGAPIEMEQPAPDLLIVDVSWSPDSRNVIAELQDREQTWLDLMRCDAATGKMARILHETTKAWVSRQPSPKWLKDGSFLWLSERDGYSHIYRVSPDGAAQTQLTHGQWEVDDILAVDEKRGYVWFAGDERSPTGLDVYRMKVDGSGMQRMTEIAGTHHAVFNPGSTLYLDTWSDITTPPRVTLYDESGKLVRVIDENRVPVLDELALTKPEFVHVKTRDGFVMEAVLFRPTEFDASKKYPVYEYTYSGPHAPQVRNAWAGSTYLFHQMLAEHGVAVWICDNRTASGKGVISTWPVYRNFGELELRDLEDGLAWLKSQPYIDGNHVTLSGWSFGGFMTTYALTHSKAWQAGIAGGSVTDWHDYDSIYTERYMLTPEHNKEGYERTAPRFAAKNLSGHLLLLHGLIDDNVHVQNTVQLVYELQKADKQFELMVYPKSRHGVTDPLLVKQMRTLMFDFVMRNARD
jgi:dipeptidyl-peptidase-4